MNISLFRLTSGEEIIAECDITHIVYNNRNIRSYEIKNPIIMLPMGQGEIGLAPWIPYCDTKSLMIPETSVLFTATPQKNLRDQYASAVSGIVIPNPSLGQNLRLISE
jgi:hypothetical protein